MMQTIPLPRLLDASGNEARRLSPVSVSIDLSITPLSCASMVLPNGETIPARGYVELFTCMGSAGVFRVRSPQDAYGVDTTTAELEHAIVEVGDYLVLQEYDEMMAANTAMQTLFSHYRGTRWQLGSVTALGSGQVAVTVNHDRVLEAMLDILTQKPDCMMAFDFSTSPWTVSIVKKGTTVQAEGRLSRNLNYAKIIYDDTELCTRAYYERLKASTGSNQPRETEWAYVDADTMSTYGLIEREVRTGSNYTAAESLRIANEYIRNHKNPRVSVEMSAEELSGITGEEIDAFTIGKLFRLVLVDYNQLPVEKNITALHFPDVYGSPRNITVNLDQEEDTVITFIHDVDAKGGSGGGGGAGKAADDFDKRFYAEFLNTDTKVGMVVGEYVDGYKIQAGEISLAINETSGQSLATIDANHINISATDSVHVLGGSVVYDQNGNLVLKESTMGGVLVEHDDQGVKTTYGVWDRGNLTGGVMVQQINGQTDVFISGNVIDINGSELIINADHIALNGETLISDLLTGEAVISNLVVTDIANTTLSSDYGTIENLTSTHVTVEGDVTVANDYGISHTGVGTFSAVKILGDSNSATWQTYSARRCGLSNSHYYYYGNSYTDNTIRGAVSGYVVTGYTDVTLHYLGRAST